MGPRTASSLLVALMLGAEARAQDPLSPEIHAALQDWRARHGASWQLVHDQVAHRGRMLFGGSAEAPFRPRREPEWRLLALSFVMEAFPLLRVEHETLRHDRVIELPLGQVGTSDKLAVRFRQEVRGVPVQHGWVDVLFELASGRLLAIDAQALADTSGLDVTATVDGTSAAALALETFAAETGARTAGVHDPRLVLFEHGEARVPTLAWEVSIGGELADGRGMARSYLVAARGAPAVLARIERIHEAIPQDSGGRRGRVLASATEDGCCFDPDDGTNRVLLPMAGMTVRFADGSTAVTGEDGLFSTPAELSTARTASLGFQGPFVAVHNFDFWPEGDVEVRAELGAGLTTIELNPLPAEREVAQANAFQRANQMRAWIRRVNPFDTTMDSAAETPGVPYRIVVNWVIPWGEPGGPEGMAPCNAIFDAHQGVVKLSVGGAEFGQSCPNAAFAPVIWHELGHWLGERYSSGNDLRGFGEGNADAFALYQMNRPRLVYGEVTRSGENTVPFCGDCESEQGCLGEPHADGLPLMGALWKVRRNLMTTLGPDAGAALADALFLGWMNAFDQDRIHSIVEWQWLVLDDDDGDIVDGTPHLAAIDRGFREQGFPGFRLPVTTVICR